MKNIEKYTNTKEALAVYDSNRENTWYTFEQWLDADYIEPHVLTLLEAAEAVVKVGYGTFVDDLCSAVKREKAKPVRNCDKYRTVDEAQSAYRAICKMACSICKYRSDDGRKNCAISWLYAEADKEVAE